MSDALSFAEFDGQQVELLPARTVLSLFAQGTDGGYGAPGLPGYGDVGLKIFGIPIGNSNSSGSGSGIGGDGGSANGGS